MRPAISDSLISGQPLYLLNSNANFGAPAVAVPLLVARATHATGNVRLHVTGNPPTTRAFGLVCVQALSPSGRAAAISPWSTARRERMCGLMALRSYATASMKQLTDSRPVRGSGSGTKPFGMHPECRELRR